MDQTQDNSQVGSVPEQRVRAGLVRAAVVVVSLGVSVASGEVASGGNSIPPTAGPIGPGLNIADFPEPIQNEPVASLAPSREGSPQGASQGASRGVGSQASLSRSGRPIGDSSAAGSQGSQSRSIGSAGVTPSVTTGSQPVGPEASSGTKPWLADTSLALLAVLSVVGVLYTAFRMFGVSNPRASLAGRAPSPAGLMEVLGRYPIGRGTVLILLRVDRRVLLLSQTPGGRLGGASMTTLAELTEPEDVASVLTKVRDADGEGLSSRFRSMLAAFESSPENAVPPATLVDHTEQIDRDELAGLANGGWR